MGSNTSTTIQQLQKFQHQEEQQVEGNTISSSNNNNSIFNNNNSSNNNLRQRASSMRESWSSLKQLSPNNNNNLSSDEEKNNSLPSEKQPSILGFVGDLIGIKQTTSSQHHHKAISDMEQQHSRISESSILSSPLRMANNNTNNINVNNNSNGNDEGFQPIYSSKSVFSRPRAKSYGSSSLKNSQSSRTNSSSISNNSILTRNQVRLNSSYDHWNTDTICWEEFKRKSIERENKRKKVPKDVSSSWSPIHSGGQSPPNSYQNSANVSMSMNIIQSPRRREGIILAPITNRVGMEVERTGIGNFLKNLEQPSRLTQSIK